MQTILVLVAVLISGSLWAKNEQIEASVYTPEQVKEDWRIKSWTKADLVNGNHFLNQGLKNAFAVIDRDKGVASIMFDYESTYWWTGANAFPLLIRFFDKNGQLLDMSKTPHLVPRYIYNRTKPGTYGRLGLDGGVRNYPKADVMDSEKNSYGFTLKQPVAQHAHSVEIGFAINLAKGGYYIKGYEKSWVPKGLFRDWKDEKAYSK